jgi:Mg-chelatase subunit ChlD
MRIRLAGAALGVVAAGAGQAVFAQAQSGFKLSAGPAYTSKDGQGAPQFPVIDIRVHLTASDGTPKEFQAAEMRLFSGGTEIAQGSSLRSFAECGYGVRAVLALDASGSMRGAPLAAIHASIANFVNQARAQDKVAVLTFADDSRVEVPFGADKSTLAARLREVTSRGTKTRLYDGLLDALSQLESAPPEFRQLTVISDGHDEGSRHTLQDVIHQAVTDHIAIDAIGLTRGSAGYLQALAQMANATGGNYQRARSAQDLDTLINQGIQGMRAAPVVQFAAGKLDGDGQKHTLEERWSQRNATAQVSVTAPLMPQTASPWRMWGWVLGGCFVAGSLLLYIARRPAARQTAVAVLSSQEPVAQPAPNVVRSGQTVFEKEPAIEPRPPARHTPTQVEAVPRPAPARTQVAALFEAGENGHGARLEAIAGPMAGKCYEVRGDFLVGALEGNQLQIEDDGTLSGRHARLRLADSVLTIEDNQSTNGTYVNGARIGSERKLLKPGDEIRMGKSVFRVRRD